MRVWLSKNETFFWNFEPPWSRVFYANRAAVPGCFLLQFRHFFECISKDTIFFKRLCNILFCHKIIDLNCFKKLFSLLRPPTCCQHFTPNFQAKRENTKTHMLWLCYNFHSEIYTSFFFQTVLLLLCFVVVN